METIIKCSQILLNEKDLKILLEKIIKLIIENAGAEKGILILPKRDNWYIEAEYNINSDSLNILQSKILNEKINNIPHSIINYTIHTKDSIVINNTAEEENFLNDPYIISNKPLSVLCTPLINHANVQGILYLENNQATGAFTQKHLKILELLSVQAAISLENSVLYNELEQRVKDRTEDLLIANINLKVLSNEKTELMNIVTHNLKSPLGSVVGFASSINKLKDLSKQEIEIYSNQILSGGKRMLKMIGDLLDINAIEEGNYKINIERVNINTFIEDLILNYSDQLKAKKLNLKFENPEESFFINVDESWFAQILDNLISNSIKFSPHDKNIFIRIYNINEKIQIHIIDQGPGFTESDMERLFQKFSRLSAVPTGGETSSGLGLSIVKKMVNIMNGNVFCESEAGSGTTFIVEF